MATKKKVVGRKISTKKANAKRAAAAAAETLTPAEAKKFSSLIASLEKEVLAKLEREQKERESFTPELPSALEKGLIKEGRAFTAIVPVSVTILDGLVTVTEGYYADPWNLSIDYADDSKIKFEFDPKATAREKKLFKHLLSYSESDLYCDEQLPAAQKNPTLRANLQNLRKFVQQLKKLTKDYDFEPDNIINKILRG